MRTLNKLLVMAITSAVLGLAALCDGASLSDFGYGNMTTKRTMPTVLILVNFTNNNGTTEHTIPYQMGPDLVGINYLGAVHWYSNWFFSRTSSPKSVNGFFHEMSNGRMQWVPGEVHMVLMDTNYLHGAIKDRDGEEAADDKYLYKMVTQAINQGLDLLSYDTDGGGGVDQLECTIQLITNDETFGGGARSFSLALGPWLSYYVGRATIQRCNHGMNVIAEEMIHVLQNGHCGDIYGPSSMSAGYSVMAGNTYLHVDAWHKMQLAWCEPRIHSLRQPGLFTLSAAQLMDSNSPVILYDPLSELRGIREFFVLEYRTKSSLTAGGGYDSDVADNGLVIWHAEQWGGKDPVNWTMTYYMLLEKWWRCENCLGIFTVGQDDAQVCPLGGTNHVAESGHLGMPRWHADAGGEPGWRRCSKCGQMFHAPEVTSSDCAAGGRHLPETWDYSLRRDDDPESLGQRGWQHCSKCQSLFRPRFYDDRPDEYGVCAAGGVHFAGTNTTTYAVLWTDGVKAMMIEGAPNLSRSRGSAWHSGTTTPPLRWYDGTLSGTRIAVKPFAPSADAITIEILANYDTWVDFPYTGTEEGSFERPYNTFAEGTDTVASGGTLHIKAGSSSETRQVKKPMKIEVHGGPVRIGRK